jgi:hypothetical protein
MVWGLYGVLHGRVQRGANHVPGSDYCTILSALMPLSSCANRSRKKKGGGWRTEDRGRRRVGGDDDDDDACITHPVASLWPTSTPSTTSQRGCCARLQVRDYLPASLLFIIALSVMRGKYGHGKRGNGMLIYTPYVSTWVST